ncbi:MAG: Selenide, water dikinase [Anaerolinea thermophila]|jgi:selenide,water dikinase|uniref:Selenide, water dikinase n=1 Tax=Anaerolinea thermophila TaxID=167964 RepID=A0A101FX12_9CHLR|nr:MAG: Selenide, water dikinase [Anaerolinea thermophila]
MIGLGTPDDAAVWRLGDGRALVMTTDFFTPVVDDGYDYGAIAAANSLSDVYAMGADPFIALTIAALPPDLDISISQEIIRGLAEKTAESGAIIAGGHTIQDKEPKIGLVVLGFADEDALLRKNGLKIGDHLVITKPLGFGVTTTAIKGQEAPPEDIEEVTNWMKELNRDAAALARLFNLRAATDVTGFSFLGHAWEMASGAGVGMKFEFSKVPFISCAKKHAEAWRFPGGAADNKRYYEKFVQFDPSIPEEYQFLLFDPQTSGGLLLGVPEVEFEAFMTAAKAKNLPAWAVGKVVPGDKIIVEA